MEDPDETTQVLVWRMEEPGKKKKTFEYLLISIIVSAGFLIYSFVAHSIWIYALDLSEDEPDPVYITPKLELEVHFHQDGFYVVTVEKADVWVAVQAVKYSLLNETGTQLMGGSIVDIYGLNMDFSSHNLTFEDPDRNGQVSNEDFVLLRSAAEDGIAKPGMVFQFRHDAMDEVMGKITLPEYPEEEEDSRRSRA